MTQSSEERFDGDLEGGTRQRKIKSGDDVRVKNSDPPDSQSVDHHLGTPARKVCHIYNTIRQNDQRNTR